MSLDYDLTRIDRESLYWMTERTDPVTEAIIFLTMAAEVSDTGIITTDVAPEFYARIHAWERTRGSMLTDLDPDTDRMVPRYITWADVVGHIGLKTNVFPRMAERSWITKVVRAMRDGWLSPADPRPAPVIRSEVRELLAAGREVVRLEMSMSAQ